MCVVPKATLQCVRLYIISRVINKRFTPPCVHQTFFNSQPTRTRRRNDMKQHEGTKELLLDTLGKVGLRCFELIFLAIFFISLLFHIRWSSFQQKYHQSCPGVLLLSVSPFLVFNLIFSWIFYREFHAPALPFLCFSWPNMDFQAATIREWS